MSAPLGQTIVPSFLVNPNLLEELGITQRLEHRPNGSGELLREVNLPGETVVELQPKAKSLERLYGDDFGYSLTPVHGNGSMVRRGRRRLALAQFSASSSRCSVAHSRTSRSTRVGNHPSWTDTVARSMVAWCSA